MAVTLRNKVVEAQIKSIGKATGEGPSALITRLVANEEARLEAEYQEGVKRRLEAFDRMIAKLPVLTDEQKAAMDQIMDDMYDEVGAPK